ncbi:hypothetical protein E2C01_083882 [Portunus trituberculatus]|uniref:Uncharacterized protein n=1 Tax=Portunus trituberculatus TaxID=210409 RepID=A0A5B7J2I1_PORTR|nr:hypothetical protein [Portunus trituberculatus]
MRASPPTLAKQEEIDAEPLASPQPTNDTATTEVKEENDEEVQTSPTGEEVLAVGDVTTPSVDL